MGSSQINLITKIKMLTSLILASFTSLDNLFSTVDSNLKYFYENLALQALSKEEEGWVGLTAGGNPLNQDLN